jgi:putative aldouronate transport system substrate-binding protein
MTEQLDTRITRRGLLGGAGALGLGALVSACGGSDGDEDTGSTSTPTGGGQTTAAGGPTAAASGGSGAPSGSASSSGGATPTNPLLPAYVPYTGVQPSGPSTSDLVAPTFDEYPANPVAFTQGPPLSGGDVDVFTNTNVGTPTPLDKNTFWQEFNKRAGAKINYTMVPNAQYLAKLQTAIAGGTLGEIVSMRSVANMPELMKKEFTDLSPWLSGDNAKSFPALANIPTISWRSSVYADGLYTIPLPRIAALGQMTIRTDVIEQAGADPNITSYADFVKVCKAITDPGKHRWALAGPDPTLRFVREMTGNANTWAVEDGKFTYYGEQDSYTQALSAVASMWKDGLFQPDSFASPGSATSWLKGGQVNMYNGSILWPFNWEVPNSKWKLIVAPKYDGGGSGSQYYATAQYGNGMALKKSSDSRIKELLTFMNWLASPFGTKEYFFLHNGVEGVDYTMKDGSPVQTERGKSELTLPVGYTAAPAYVIYSPGYPDVSKMVYDWEIEAAKVAVLDPSIGLYSATDQTKGATLSKTLSDLEADIIQGRKDVKDWTSAMKTWRSSGGDAIRSEYEKAYAAGH